MSCISKLEYYAIIRAGLTPKKHELDDFSEACFDQNSVDELLEVLKARKACTSDMIEWNITAHKWRGAIKKALESMAFYFEFDHAFYFDCDDVE